MYGGGGRNSSATSCTVDLPLHSNGLSVSRYGGFDLKSIVVRHDAEK